MVDHNASTCPVPRLLFSSEKQDPPFGPPSMCAEFTTSQHMMIQSPDSGGCIEFTYKYIKYIIVRGERGVYNCF